MTAPVDPIAVALQVVDTFESLGIACTVGGSIAASFAGEPRSTIDIDLVVALDLEGVPDVVAALRDDFYLDARALERAIRQRSNTNLIHHATQLTVDLFVVGGTPLDAQQLARRLWVAVGGGLLPIHPPEDILLQKLRWFRVGGEVSDRQWRDMLAIVRVQGAHLDTDYLRANASALGVEDLLSRVLEERPSSAQRLAWTFQGRGRRPGTNTSVDLGRRCPCLFLRDRGCTTATSAQVLAGPGLFGRR